VCVSETSEVFKQLTRLSAREEFIQFARSESLKTCVTYMGHPRTVRFKMAATELARLGIGVVCDY
jgi:hypothetical protein